MSAETTLREPPSARAERPCPACGQPWLVRYPDRRLSLTDRAEIHRGHGMWRFRRLLPLAEGEAPVTLGEGDTPLLRLDRAAPTAWVVVIENRCGEKPA